MTIDLTQIILAVIALLGGILTTFVIPFINKKLTAQQIENIRKAARIAVYAAEQLFTPEQWAEKKKYAQEYLKAQGYNIDTVQIDAAIEAEVLALHGQLKPANE